MMRVAVVGAGMAGAAAARRLADAGHRVAVFDKGRGLGGRMATRRLPCGLAFDHGAQFVTARDPGFAAILRGLAGAGAAAPWGEAGWSVGTPAMTAPVRALAAGIPVTTGCTVARLRREDAVWRLTDAGGTPVGDAFDAVLVTAPAPQARTLAATADVAWPELWPALDRVRYAPCWTLMLAHGGGPVFAQTHRRERDPDAALTWIARDGTKPGRAGAGRDEVGETLVVQASPAWSRAHLEDEPDAVARRLIAALRALPGSAAPEDARITHAAAHRWRYAMVEEPVGAPCLWSPGLWLGFAGDGFLGARVEAAYLSGTALADAVLASA